MQACTLLQTDNHTGTPPLCFLQAGCPSCRPTNSVKALKAYRDPAVDIFKMTHKWAACSNAACLPLYCDKLLFLSHQIPFYSVLEQLRHLSSSWLGTNHHHWPRLSGCQRGTRREEICRMGVHTWGMKFSLHPIHLHHSKTVCRHQPWIQVTTEEKTLPWYCQWAREKVKK